MRGITSATDAAFVVTVDGTKSQHVYCEAASSCLLAVMALKKCQDAYKWRCVFFAKGKDPLFAFEVVEFFVPLESSDPIMLCILKQDDLTRMLVGHRLQGYFLNNLKWSEYHAPDGKIYFGDRLLTYSYKIRDGKLCYDHEETIRDVRAFINREGDHLKYVSENGELLGEFVDTWVLAGQH